MQELKLNELTLEQKIGLVICSRGGRDDEDKAFILEMVRKKAVGGIQIAFVVQLANPFSISALGFNLLSQHCSLYFPL